MLIKTYASRGFSSGLVALVITACGGDDSGDSASPVDSKVSDADKQIYVDAINAVRASVTEPSNYAGTWAALPNVTWSDTVAASAQGWANHLASSGCKLEHASNIGYGENLAMGTRLTAASAVAMWASEVDKYTWSPTYSAADFNAGSGHYTQLVWRASVQIGCGVATCGTSVIVSCRFSPPGNSLGQSVY